VELLSYYRRLGRHAHRLRRDWHEQLRFQRSGRGVGARPYADAVSKPGLRPSLAVRLGLLAGAYSPLMVLLAVLGIWDQRWLRVGLFSAGLLSFLSCLYWLRVWVPRRAGIPEKIYRAKPREGEALKFFASYVIPFFIAVSASSASRWGLLVYLAILLALYLQGDLYFTNPVIGLMGYRLFQVSREDGGYLLVLTRQWQLTPDMVVRLVSLGGYVHVDVSSRELPR